MTYYGMPPQSTNAGLDGINDLSAITSYLVVEVRAGAYLIEKTSREVF